MSDVKKLSIVTAVLVTTLATIFFFYGEKLNIGGTDKKTTQKVTGFHNISIGEHRSNVTYKKGKPVNHPYTSSENIKIFQDNAVEFLNDRVISITYYCPTANPDPEELLGIVCGTPEKILEQKFKGEITKVCSIQYPEERYFVIQKMNVVFGLRQERVSSMEITSEDPMAQFNTPLAVDCGKLGTQ